MKLKHVTISVEELKLGDRFKLYEGVEWICVSPPINSTNQQLFWDFTGNACVVVGVQYPDLSRGSRLFPPDAKIGVVRDVSQKD